MGAYCERRALGAHQRAQLASARRSYRGSRLDHQDNQRQDEPAWESAEVYRGNAATCRRWIELTRDEIFRDAVESIRRTFKLPALVVSDATTANDVPGWDSLAHASVLVRLEKHFNVRLPEQAAYDSRNVGELVDAIASVMGP